MCFWFCPVLSPETSTVLSVDEKQRCSTLHFRSFSFFHWLEGTVRVLTKYVEFRSWVTLSVDSLSPISQVTFTSNTVWTEHVAFTWDLDIITVLKLGTSMSCLSCDYHAIAKQTTCICDRNTVQSLKINMNFPLTCGVLKSVWAAWSHCNVYLIMKDFISIISHS